MKLKFFIKIILVLGVCAFVSGVLLQYHNLIKAREEVQRLNNNYSTLEREYNGVLDKNTVYLFTIEDLKNSRDSITIKLEETRKELRLKDKQIKEMGYLLSEARKKDTVIFRDTIFKERIVVDTVITDSLWYSTKMHLEYPNIISLEQSFLSEKELLFYQKKETINPSKCWLFNIFKKKRETMEVIVEEKNPYIKNKKQKFIHVIK